MDESSINIGQTILTAAGTFLTGILVLLRIKSSTDVKLDNMETVIEKQGKDLKEDIKEQKNRIDDRVHVNEFDSHKKLVRSTFTDYQTLVDTKFDYIKEALERIEEK